MMFEWITGIQIGDIFTAFYYLCQTNSKINNLDAENKGKLARALIVSRGVWDFDDHVNIMVDQLLCTPAFLDIEPDIIDWESINELIEE